MKKINSIHYGGKIISVGLLFLFAIPVCLYLIQMLWHVRLFSILMIISICIGVVIEAGFGCLLFVELRQDKKIDQYYSEHKRSQKTPQEILDKKDSQ